MLKTVNDHPGYAAAHKILSELAQGRDALEAEVRDLDTDRKLNKPLNSGVSQVDLALAAIRGETPPKAQPVNALAQRQCDAMQTLDAVNRVLNFQPLEVEHQRNLARQQAVQERAPQVEAIAAAWNAARKSLRIALEAEEALIDELAQGGFGKHLPSVTNPQWLNREHALRDLRK